MLIVAVGDGHVLGLVGRPQDEVEAWCGPHLPCFHLCGLGPVAGPSVGMDAVIPLLCWHLRVIVGSS